MDISKVTFEFESLDDNEYTIEYTATAEGIVVEQIEIFDEKQVISFTVPLEDVSRTYFHSDTISRHVHMLLNVHGFNELSLIVEAGSLGKIISAKWDVEKLQKRHAQFVEDDDSVDRNVDLGLHHFGAVIKPIINRLYDVSIEMAKMLKIKGLDCPVLKEPLKKNCIWLKKCDHYVSKEAWNQISYKKDSSDKESYKPCPLCRCKYENPSQWD
jgi:hypothetical protein